MWRSHVSLNGTLPCPQVLSIAIRDLKHDSEHQIFNANTCKLLHVQYSCAYTVYWYVLVPAVPYHTGTILQHTAVYAPRYADRLCSIHSDARYVLIASLWIWPMFCWSPWRAKNFPTKSCAKPTTGRARDCCASNQSSKSRNACCLVAASLSAWGCSASALCSGYPLNLDSAMLSRCAFNRFATSLLMSSCYRSVSACSSPSLQTFVRSEAGWAVSGCFSDHRYVCSLCNLSCWSGDIQQHQTPLSGSSMT